MHGACMLVCVCASVCVNTCACVVVCVRACSRCVCVIVTPRSYAGWVVVALHDDLSPHNTKSGGQYENSVESTPVT